MKKVIAAMAFVALMCSGALAAVSAGGVEINSTNFPDDNFRSYVSGSFDVDGDGTLSDSEIASVTSINVNSRGISSLQGVGYFTALTELYCDYNQLTALDISNNTALTELRCLGNQLTTLDVSNNTALTYLDCQSNQLTALNVSNNTVLQTLYCHNNQLITLDVSKNTALSGLYCGGNQLTLIDVSNNTALTHLGCSSNQLASLDLSNNTALTELSCAANQLTALDVSHSTANLIILYCQENQLTTLDVSHNTALVRLICSCNQLAALDLSNNTALTDLDYRSQDVSPLNITSSGNTSYPYQLNFSGYMSSDKIANVSNVQGYESGDVSISTSYANGIAQFTASPAKVTYNYATGYTGPFSSSVGSMDVTISDSSTEALTLTASPSTLSINVGGTATVQLTASNLQGTATYTVSADARAGATLSGNTGATETVTFTPTEAGTYIVTFTVNDSGRTTDNAASVTVTLNVTSNPVPAGSVAINATNFPDSAFRSYVSGSFDVNSDGILSESEIANVTSISARSMGISSLQGVEYFTALQTLWCDGNQLTALDLSRNTSLTYLYCPNNQLTTLNVSSNTALTALECDNNQLTALNVSNNTALIELHCTNNRLTALDLSNNGSLSTLYCSSNPLGTLNVSSNRSLTALECNSNQLTALDVRSNTNLAELYCTDNQLTALDVSSNNALHTLHCSNNQLTALDVSGNSSLQALRCDGNQLTTLDMSGNSLVTDLQCSPQSIPSSRVSVPTSSPYQVNFSDYMTSAQIANVSGVQGVNSDGSNITTTYANGIAMFASRPSSIRYSYATGSSLTPTMNVTLAVSQSPVPDDEDPIIAEYIRLGYLDSMRRPIVTFGGDGSNFTGTVKQGEVITRTVSILFRAQTWNLYINGERFSVPAGNGGTVETTALADGVTITTNADGTSATITLDTKEFPSGSSSIELGVLPEGGTQETGLADLGTVTVSSEIEQAVISVVVLSDDVLQKLADSVSVDRSEIHMLTSDDFDPREAPEPTEAMKETAKSDNYELVAKLNTIQVDRDGWYVFQVNVSGDIVGTSVNDLQVYVAEESDFAAGSFRSAFGILPLINGISGGFEIHSLFGIKLDTVPKQFLALIFLSAGKSLTMYIGKILLMLLAAGCAATSGLGIIAAVVIFAVKRFKKRR